MLFVACFVCVPRNSSLLAGVSAGCVVHQWAVRRYLEVQSSGRRDEVRLHYVAAGGSAARVETFSFRLADGAWHRLALAVSGAQATLLVDCHPLYRRLIPPPDRNFTMPMLSLWLGQRNSKHSLFKGTIQDVRLVSGPHGYLAQCPGLDSECPTCGQFALLQATVQELTTHIHDLSLKLVGAEARLERLEQCDCQKSCFSNGTVHADGATWQRDCNRCSCVHGEITCRPVECGRAECKNPVLHEGECCPKCLKQCLQQGKLYEHGERSSPKECLECLCHDGFMPCVRKEPEAVCPLLPCDPSDQFSVPGECCKFCPGVDYCNRGHSCDENATCINMSTKYTCKCNQGFQGDGLTCRDVDECQEAGNVDGHHCHSNTRCVNVVGGYVCQCHPGYTRRDKFNCVEVDECEGESHGCHADAVCSNTPGSYTCRCRDGYDGDGYTCNRKYYLTKAYKLCEDDGDQRDDAASIPSKTNTYIYKTIIRKLPIKSPLSTQQSARLLSTMSTAAVAPASCCPHCEARYHCRHQEMHHVTFRSGERWLYQCQICECLVSMHHVTFRSGERWLYQCQICECLVSMHHVTFRSGERWLYQCQICECLVSMHHVTFRSGERWLY
ncbi:Protein kinase C-binding protein NELL1 [Operophtera brumata]|uniref:Protein kinase C-binding protein NELL1 n=1 Tax=Operophtera brumata TaxID=104452 RepID=A0A0L7LC37_OPEBR|nr:Protein kinase C-binding protein NELL1 [Operophtera brumata]